MVIFTHVIIVFISCLILAVHTEISGSNITLCCPVGKQLDQFLSCGETSNFTEEDIRIFLSEEMNIMVNKVTVLSTDFKPTTYFENVTSQDLNSNNCLDLSSKHFLDVQSVRKIKLNLCCPLEKVLNTKNDLCESSRNQSFKVSVQPSNSQTLMFSSYTIEEFDLKEEKPPCDRQNVSYYNNNNDVCIKNDTCMGTRFFISLTDKLTMHLNGTLQESFEKEKFCLAANQNGDPVARLCYKDPCAGAACFTKCCEQGQYLSLQESKCVDFEVEVPPVDLEVKDIDGAETHRNLSKHVSRYGIPTCAKVTEIQDIIMNKFDLYLKPKKDIWFLPNGSLVVAVFYESKVHNLYCYDHDWHKDSKTYRPVAIVCSPVTDSERKLSGRYKAMAILMIISCIFLALTIAVHLLLPDLRNIHGITVVCNSLSLIVNFLIIGSLNLGYSPDTGSWLCKAMGITGHYFFMSAFAWLSVMGLDVYLSFRVSASRNYLRHRIDLKTLAIYSAIAWGLPGLFSIFTVVMDHADLPYHVVTANFGVQSCWFYNEKSVVGLYLYAPVCLFLLFNMLCFSSLAVKFYVASRDAIVLSPRDETRSRERMLAILKLFLLMGISWIFEILSWAIGGAEQNWYFTDALNILKPVFVFVIFVCRRRVLDLLALRYHCFGVFLRMTFDWAPISQHSKNRQNSSVNSTTYSKKQTSSM